MLLSLLAAATIAAAPASSSIDAANAEPAVAPAIAADSSASSAEPAAAPEPAKLRRSGRFGIGLSLGPIGFGVAEVVGHGGVAVGPTFVAGLQVDLGSRLALRLPIEATIGAGSGGYLDLAVTPGLLWRFRSSADQFFVPYVGAGWKLGAFSAHHELLGLPLSTGSSLRTLASADLDDLDDGDGGRDDPDQEAAPSYLPELWLGADLQLGRLVAMELGLTYAYQPIAGTAVSVVSERIAFRLTF
jgi:hypothetical protein